MIVVIAASWSTRRSGLIESLTSPEILFAIKLSLITSVISTAFCVVAAVPVAYSLVRFSFRAGGS